MIKSVHKAMRILSVLSDSKGKPVKLSDISDTIGENKSTCSHILKTLEQDGYVEQVSHSKGYTLGPSSYCLTRYGKYNDDFVALSRPVLRYLHKHTEQTVILAIIQNNTKFIIDYIDVEKRIFTEDANIRPDDIYRTATGRIMLANMDNRLVIELYEKLGNPGDDWTAVNSLETLQKELSRIDKRGVLRTVATYDDECHIGYAAPIYRRGRCIAAVGVAIYCNTDEMDEILNQRDEKIKLYLKKSANEITRRLNYSE